MILSVEPTARATLQQTSVDAVLCGYFADEKPARGLFGLLDYERCGALSRLRKRGFASGAEGEVLMYSLRLGIPAERLLAVGLGNRSDFTPLRARAAMASLLDAAEGAKIRRILLEAPGRPTALEAEAAFDVALGALEDRLFGRVQIVDDARWLVALRARLQERGRKLQDRSEDV